MENYEKEPSHIEHQVETNHNFDAPELFHMEVGAKSGAKSMSNRVLKVLSKNKPVVLFANGKSTAVAVSCAEIVKSYHKQIFQITRVGQVRYLYGQRKEQLKNDAY